MRTLLPVLGLSALLILGTLYAQETWAFPLSHWKIYLVVGLFAALSFLSNNLAGGTEGERPQKQVNQFLMSLIIKLVIGVGLFIALVLVGPKEEALPFGIFFLGVYISFTVLIGRFLTASKA